MVNGNLRACAETSPGAEPICHGADEHVNGGGGDIVQLRETTTGTTNSAKRVRFIEDKAVLVLLLEFNLENGVSERRR